ncbi:MAG: putative sugar nucleotidyl transferase [Planctomycetota bacterium]|nr:putative sugar nucleotidyl transferase [Planctomycetota bacterium]
MRLILFEGPSARRANFHPLSLSRPIWELRCGINTLIEKLIAKIGADDVACFVEPYMADSYRAGTEMKVNDPITLTGDDLFIVNGRVKAAGFDVSPTGPSEVGVAEDGEVLYARIAAGDLGKVKTGGIDELLESAAASLPTVTPELQTWNYIWDLVLSNPEQLTEDFNSAGRSGIEGTVEQPGAIRGGKKDVFVAAGAVIHPMVVIDAENGPVYLDEDVEVHPFTRIEGPCYVGKKSILLGAKCREGNSIGPVCRIGGEVEESIIQGYSNKYHDGFLGHAYVGEWVNLGALTTNSDLKNDYSDVSVMLNGRRPINTGSTKVGSLIGDHTKTAIGTLLNTGSYVGAMALIMPTGKPLPKFIPSFAWFLDGVVTKGFGRKKLYETAAIAMGRRKRQWTDTEQAMWEAIFEITAPVRDEALLRGRRKMTKK